MIENLNGDRDLAAKGMQALARALSQSTPRGKQNTFAHHPRAYYILAEAGSQAPRDLSGAFFDPVKQQPWLEASVAALKSTRDAIDSAYGKVWDQAQELHVGRAGTLDEIVQFAVSATKAA